jgi:hypothetical protein
MVRETRRGLSSHGRRLVREHALQCVLARVHVLSMLSVRA